MGLQIRVCWMKLFILKELLRKMLYIKKIFKCLSAYVNKFALRYVKTYRNAFDDELMNHNHWVWLDLNENLKAKLILKAKYNQEVGKIFFEETF